MVVTNALDEAFMVSFMILYKREPSTYGEFMKFRYEAQFNQDTTSLIEREYAHLMNRRPGHCEYNRFWPTIGKPKVQNTSMTFQYTDNSTSNDSQTSQSNHMDQTEIDKLMASLS